MQCDLPLCASTELNNCNAVTSCLNLWRKTSLCHLHTGRKHSPCGILSAQARSRLAVLWWTDVCTIIMQHQAFKSWCNSEVTFIWGKQEQCFYSRLFFVREALSNTLTCMHLPKKKHQQEVALIHQHFISVLMNRPYCSSKSTPFWPSHIFQLCWLLSTMLILSQMFQNQVTI